MTMPGTTGGQSMPGMMSDTDMTKLPGMKGAEFDRMWLQMMVQHHQGAIDRPRPNWHKVTTPTPRPWRRRSSTANRRRSPR